MQLNILNEEQKLLLPFISKYSKSYYLVGGTAIAMHLGHRKSIDFDLFTADSINKLGIKKQVSQSGFPYYLMLERADQIHFVINAVKLTFFEFPFPIAATFYHENYFRIPDLLTLGAMKAFALGGRGKWKDYVDLFFILKHCHSIKDISNRAKDIFQDVFNPLLFSKQLCYFNDISFEEQIEFMPGFEVAEIEVKEFLVNSALEGF